MTLINQGVSCLIDQTQVVKYGESAIVSIPLNDGNGQPITPSGYGINFQVRSGYTSPVVISLDETSPYITSAEGLIEVYLPSSMTQIAVNDYVMGCRINDNAVTNPVIVDVYTGTLSIKYGPVQ